MRVAVTVEQSWHRVPGGTAASILRLLGALADRDDVEVVGVAARHGGPAPDEWAPPVPVAHLPVPRQMLYETWHLPGVRFPRVERATGPVDVVHGSAIAYPATAAPVVVTVHDLAFLHDRSLGTRHGMRFFRRGTVLARRHAAVVVCPSEATRRECLDAGFDADRLRVVPWGVAAPPLAPGEVEAARARHGLPARYALFSGTVEPRKNLPALLDAWAALGTDVPLVVAGPDGWNEDIDGWAAALGPRVVRVGFLPRAELDALVAGAAVVCYPSRAEGFGLPVLEAMARGVPVVTSLGTATEEVAGDAAQLVDPYDVASIAAGVAAVLDDPGRAAALGEAGRERAAGYTWARTAAGYVDAYRDAMAGGPR